MGIEFTEEQELFRKNVRNFVEREVIPRADAQEEDGEFPWDWFNICADLGFFGVRYPEEFGGNDAGFVAYCIMGEEIARGSMSLGAIIMMQCMMATDFIYRFGTAEHKEKLLKPAIVGKKVGAFALTEANAGSDLGGVQTTVVRDGNEYVLNGSKLWITNSQVADFFTVLATRDKELGVNGVDFFSRGKGNTRPQHW